MPFKLLCLLKIMVINAVHVQPFYFSDQNPDWGWFTIPSHKETAVGSTAAVGGLYCSVVGGGGWAVVARGVGVLFSVHCVYFLRVRGYWSRVLQTLRRRA